MSGPLTGIVPVAPTPFHDDGQIDEPGMRRVLDCMVEQGVDGICILANYSEQFTLTDAERNDLMRLSLEHVAGRVPVIVTTSHFSTDIAVDRAKSAQSMGAAMVMMMPPYHGALSADAKGVFEHFAAVNTAVDIPIMVQDAPLSGVSLSVPTLVQMARELENVRFFKLECPFAADKIEALIKQGGDAIVGPFDGEEAITLMADLEAGVRGTMTSALLPDKIKPIVLDFLQGKEEEASKQYNYCLPLINHENRQCGLRACKTVMKEGGVIASDRVRHPLQPLRPKTRDRLLKLAADLDVLALRWGK